MFWLYVFIIISLKKQINSLIQKIGYHKASEIVKIAHH